MSDPTADDASHKRSAGPRRAVGRIRGDLSGRTTGGRDRGGRALVGAAGDGARTPTGEAFSAGSRGGITLERPPRADFGDYSTNAALLLAPRLARAPREVAERLGAQLAERVSAGASSASRSPGPGFLNLFLADAWLRGGALRRAGGRRGLRCRAGRALRARSGRIRLGQPDRADARRATPATPPTATRWRGCWRFEGAPRRARVLRQRRRLARCASSASRSRRWRAASRFPRTAIKASTSPSSPRASSMPPIAMRRTLGRAAVAVMIEQIQTSLAAFGVCGFDHWAYESSAARRRAEPGRSRAGALA